MKAVITKLVLSATKPRRRPLPGAKKIIRGVEHEYVREYARCPYSGKLMGVIRHGREAYEWVPVKKP